MEILKKKLEELRKVIAIEEGVPPFVILSNITLSQLSIIKPIDKSTILNVKGFHNTKFEKYGERFLEIILSNIN